MWVGRRFGTGEDHADPHDPPTAIVIGILETVLAAIDVGMVRLDVTVEKRGLRPMVVMGFVHVSAGQEGQADHPSNG